MSLARSASARRCGRGGPGPWLLLSLCLGTAGPAAAGELAAELRRWALRPASAPASGVRLRALVRSDVALEPVLHTVRAAVDPVWSRARRDRAGRQLLWLELERPRPGGVGLAVALQRLSARPELLWIERAPLLVPDNATSSWLLQSGDEALGRSIWQRGLTGAGQVVGVADTGLDADACQFRLGPEPAAVTEAVDAPQPPAALVARPAAKVLTYYVLEGAEAYDSSAANYHGTHSAGNAVGDDYHRLAGRDAEFYDPHDGMAPAARLVFQDIGSHDGYLSGLRAASMYDLLHQAYATGARIHSNSYGRAEPAPGYDLDSAAIDEAVWDHHDLLVLFSAGNAGPEPATLNGTGATAKNTLVVGASGPVALDVFGSIFDLRHDLLFFSSQGPTADGRLKPDLVAPGMTFSATSDTAAAEHLGCCDRDGEEIYAAAVDDDNCDVDQDWPAVGTSFSTPVTAGVAALARQYFTEGFWRAGRAAPEHGFSPSAALLKAVLILGARPLAGEVFMSDAALEPPPAAGQGWGRVRLEPALWFAGEDQHSLVLADAANPVIDAAALQPEPPFWPHGAGPLAEGEQRSWLLPAVAAGAELRVCLAWSDPPALPAAERMLINDLDLSLTGPAGARWLGNRGFGADGLAEPAAAAEPDRRNNVECVALRAPRAGAYAVAVEAASVPGNGQPGSAEQGFALLAAAPFLPPRPEVLRPARAAPGAVLEDVELEGRHFATGMQLDLGPEIEVAGLEVIDAGHARIVELRVAAAAATGPRAATACAQRSLCATSAELLRVGRPGCGCSPAGPAAPPGAALALLLLGLLARRRFGSLSR